MIPILTIQISDKLDFIIKIIKNRYDYVTCLSHSEYT